MRYANSAARCATVSVALSGAIVLAKPAWTQEYCVACTGPAALYRCVLERATPTGIPLKLLCIKTLARQGGHATCAIRSGTVFDCDAPIRRIDVASAATELSSPAANAPSQIAPPSASPPSVGLAPAATPPAGPKRAVAPPDRDETTPPPAVAPQRPTKPQPVEDFAKNISRSSKEALGKAGTAIKVTTKKTWDCIASFFKSC
ncbi:MAG: hypothetical protein AB7E81_24955 [Hyphomicrobiaceae bacterium]